ncbi:hypothetical protein [Paracoccus cavernae]
MPHMKNPDMAAFTIGLVMLALQKRGESVSLESIQAKLETITRSGVEGRVTPEMARGALLTLYANREYAD